ncbi:MAG: hypothetical protein MJ252_14970 [archaeon]|nr:hypothetical protein [archaeon]
MPKWLENDLEEIRKKYPELINQKVELINNFEEGEIPVAMETKNKKEENDLEEDSKDKEYIGKKTKREKSKSRNKSKKKRENESEDSEIY